MAVEQKAARRVYLDFVGCRLNQAEIEQMAHRFRAQGDQIVASLEEADLVVVNTCAVTLEAARKSRQIIRQAGRTTQNISIIATGCYAQLAPEKLADLPQVAQVVDNQEKDHLVELVSGNPLYEREPLQRDPLPPGTLGHTRAFIKVQDGCDNKCTFCVTTLARGAGRSRARDEIIDEINLLHQSGYREAVLTGVHLGSYGQDRDDQIGLAGLIQAILDRTAIPRLRLSSLEPWDINPDFFDLWQDSRLCPHLHLPLQSGCDDTLRRMARRTTQKAFAALVDEARQRIPRLTVTTDIITGFPGETDEHFAESLRYVEQFGFARLHVFSYSSRPGTAAAAMSGQLSKGEIKARAARVQALSDRLWQEYQGAQIGQKYTVLWESARAATPDGLIWPGLTENYLRVVTTSSADLANTITPVTIIALQDGELLGAICV